MSFIKNDDGSISGVIGEKISLRRVTVLEKTDSQVFGAYKHMGGRIVTVTFPQK